VHPQILSENPQRRQREIARELRSQQNRKASLDSIKLFYEQSQAEREQQSKAARDAAVVRKRDVLLAKRKRKKKGC
jgi:hypothetical protein